MNYIESFFYENLFERSNRICQEAKSVTANIETILKNRTTKGLSLLETAYLIHSVLSKQDHSAKKQIIQKSRELRKELFKNKIATMVPIEISSYCASNCNFCGWRNQNTEMIRLKISKIGLVKQVDQLAKIGFDHFELASGDDLPMIKNDLPELIELTKNTAKKHQKDVNVSICLTPMHESHYAKLKNSGLDCVLTWQETYDRKTFYSHVTQGSKAKGITEDFKINQSGDGFMERMKSQESAIRAGLQVGIGVMIGLCENLEADLIALVTHGRKLIETYSTSKPLIIGMPTWNKITTASSDLIGTKKTTFSSEDLFEVISAILLLSFPDKDAWIFPNCRVSIKTQIESVKTAGCFTSTMVRVGPGAYLANNKKTNLENIFEKTSSLNELSSEDILKGEQFVHHYHQHEDYLEMFKNNQLTVVNQRELA